MINQKLVDKVRSYAPVPELVLTPQILPGFFNPFVPEPSELPLTPEQEAMMEEIKRVWNETSWS